MSSDAGVKPDSEHEPAPIVSPRAAAVAAWTILLLIYILGAAKIGALAASQLGDALILSALALAMIKRRIAQSPWRLDDFDYSLGAWILASPVWLAMGILRQKIDPNPYGTALYGGGASGPMQFFVNQLAAFAAYFLVTGVGGANKRDDEPVALAIEISAGVTLLLCLIERLAAHQLVRLEATFTNANLLASYLVLATPLVLCRALTRERGTAGSAARLLLAAGLCVAMVFTQSRGGEIGLLAAFAVLAAGYAARSEHWQRIKRPFAIISTVLVCSAAGYALIAKKALLTTNNRAIGDATRFDTWRAVWPVFKAHPLIGTGFGGIPAALLDLHLTQRAEIQPGYIVTLPFYHVHAHDFLLNVAAERGILGLVLLTISLRILAKRWYSVFGRNHSIMALAAAAALTGWFVQNIADFTLWFPVIGVVTFALIGLMSVPAE